MRACRKKCGTAISCTRMEVGVFWQIKVNSGFSDPADFDTSPDDFWQQAPVHAGDFEPIRPTLRREIIASFQRIIFVGNGITMSKPHRNPVSLMDDALNAAAP